MTTLTRREMLAAAVAAGAILEAIPMTVTASSPSSSEVKSMRRDRFRFCLNTSTIQGQKLTLVEEIDLAAKAGYHAIEPWINEIERHVASGGSAADLRKRIVDHGLTVESSIGFAEWIVDDDARRAKGLEVMKRDMELVASIGGKRIAAPPMGATDEANLDLRAAAERYRAIVDIGDQIGVIPMAEVWGFSKSLTRLGEAACVAIESGHPKACILPDVYHLYKGGSDVNGLGLLSKSAVHVLHLNDYPALPQATITDADRVYPGDGIAPLKHLFEVLDSIGYDGVLSIELFNHTYWKQDALTVAKTALEKARAATQL